MPRWPKNPIDRFHAGYDKDKNTGCWLWKSGVNKTTGYAQIHIKGQRLYTHRLSYEIHKGPIPRKLEIDHLCRVRHCVNPDHLEAVTRRENLLRGNTVVAENAAKTHCPKGHEFTTENTYIEKLPNRSKRHCKKCRTLQMKAFKVGLENQGTTWSEYTKSHRKQNQKPTHSTA